MACKGCGKKKTVNTYYENKFKVSKSVDSPDFTPTASQKKTTIRKGLECEVTYEGLLNCLTTINKTTLDTAEKALIRGAIADMISNINKVCPDIDKYNTIKEKIYGSISV